MAKKKKFGASLKKQTELLPVVKEKAPKTISTNVSTGGMRSAVSSTTQSVAKSARQKAEEERSARMRQGLSSVVRSSFNRQMSRPTYINKSTVNRLNQLNKTVTNPLAPIKQKQVTGGNGVGGQRLFSKERSLLNNTKFVTGGQGIGGKTVTYSPIGRAKSSVLAPIKEDIQNNPYDAVRKVGMKGSRNERRVYVPMSQRDENGQISTNQRRLENAARGGNRKAAVEAALARTKAQTRSGHTYDQYVNAELNRRGLLGQDYILRGKDPSQEAIDYRNKYGFDEEALNQIKAIADNAPASGDYNERFNGQDNGSVLDRIKFGLDESWRARNIEDTYKRMYGKSVDDDTQAKLDAVRDSGGYMVGNMLGQASQFAMTAPYSGVLEGSLMARMGLKGGRAAINTTADALKYAGARIGADQILSAPINLLDAMKEDNAKDIVKRFGLNTGMDIVFSGLLEIPSLRANSKFVKAVRANDAANAMEESAEQISAKLAAEKQLSEAISSFNPSEQRAIRERMKQLADDADARREMERAFAGESSADNLGIYNEELPSNLTDYEARRLVDTEPTPNELVRERARNFRNNSEMMFQDGGIASREAVNASIRHGVQDSDYLNWRLAYDAARRNGMVEDDAIRYADDYVISSAERANLVNREPVDTLAVANEEARRADSLLNAANGRETRDSLLDAANGRENSDALLDAANRRMANNPAFKEAKALHESANELRASGNKAMADATDMAAYKKMGEVPKEEIDLTQNEIRNANNVLDNATSNAIKPKTSAVDYIPVENKGKVYNADEDVYVTRYDNDGADFSNKPQGLYVTHRSTPSVHADAGDIENHLVIDKNAKFYDTVFDGKLQTNRMSVPIECGTTVNYLVDKIGKGRVEQLLKTDREYLVKALGEEYPNVDWSRYYDNLEMVEAYGGLVAREDGIDVVRTIDKQATSDFDTTELSVLNDSVIREDADIPTGKREPIAEEPKQLYNEPRGKNNGAEEHQSTVERAGSGEEEVRANVSAVQNGERQAVGGTHLENSSNPASTGRTGSTLSLTDEQRAVMDAAGKTNANLREADYSAFSNALNEGKASNKYGGYVDPQDVDELTKKGAKTFLSDDGSVGFAITKDGDMIGAFNRGGKYRGAVDDMLITARLNGGTKLDCYGIGLVNKYEQAGYIPVARIPFNPEYVNDPLLLANKPDVYVMMKNGDDIDTVIRKNANGEYHVSSPEELDALRTFDDYDAALKYRDDLLAKQENPKANTAQGEPKATTEPKQEPKAEPKQEAESPKDGLGRDIFNGGERYHPSGESHTEKGWKAIERKYEKRSTAWLRKEKMKLPEKVSKGMDMGEATERAKLIDSLIDEKERYRYGTVKEYNGEDVSRAFDTLSHSEKTELIHDAMRRSFVDDGIDNGIRGKIGRKVGMSPEEAVELAVSRVEKNVDEVRARLSNAASEARGGEFPSEYRNSQEYYAEVLAYLEHSTSKMEELIEKGLKDSDAYRTMEKDTTNIVSGAMALRSQEGYGAVQYNLLCRSSGEVRVAIVRKAVDDINEQFEKQLEKAAKKEGKELTDADKIRVALTDDMVDRIKKVNPDSPLEMNRLLNDISREIWNQVPANGREVADSIRKTSMLLNFKTHERNFLGNAFMIPARMLKDAIGAPFEKYAVSKGKMDIVDSSKARINRFSEEYKKLKKGADQIWAEWKDFVIGNAKYFDGAIPSASKLLGKRPIGGWGNKLLTAGIENPKLWRKIGDAVINFNGALLEWSDELFLKFHFVDSVVQSCKARGLDPSNLTSDELQSVIKTATGEAQRATFRDVSDAAKLINELKSVTPNEGRFKRGVSWVADTTLPFVNVPINVGRRAWDYSPFGLGEGIATIRKAWKTGDSKQVKKAIDKMASGTTGTGIFVIGILLGRSGGATATLSDGKEGYYEQDQGHQEYSLNIEGENGIDIPFIELKNEDGISISLSPFAPWSIPLYMGVEAGNAMDGGKINWSGLLDVAGGALSPMLDMSVLQGPSDILNSIRKSENAPAMFVNLILTTMTNHYMQYVPTLMGQMARIQDPVRRDTTSYQENSVMKNLDKTKLKFISKIPSTPLTDNSLYNISSTRLNPYLDAWGREQKTYEDSKAKRAAYELFSPTYVRQKNITALDKEINRLNKLAANEDELTVPTKFFNTALSLNGEKIQIDRNDIYEYNKVKGQETYRKASKLIETDEYRNATTEEQRKMLNQVFTEASKEAKQQTLLKKGIDEYEVYTDGFTGGKLEQAENARAAGIKGKDYYTLVTDKAADADGNGTISQPEYYNYLKGKTQYTDAQKAVLWRAKNSGWKEETNPFVTGVPPKGTGGTASTSNAKYTAEMKNSGLTEKQFAEVTSADTAKIDSNGSGRVSQAEYQAYLDGFSYLTNEQKSLLWKQYNPHWKKNPYDGSSTASSGSSKRGRSGRRSSGGSSSKAKKREKTASEKKFAALQTGKAPTNAKGIEALSSSAKGLTTAQKKALVKLMQKKLDV